MLFYVYGDFFMRLNAILFTSSDIFWWLLGVVIYCDRWVYMYDVLPSTRAQWTVECVLGGTTE